VKDSICAVLYATLSYFPNATTLHYVHDVVQSSHISNFWSSMFGELVTLGAVVEEHTRPNHGRDEQLAPWGFA